MPINNILPPSYYGIAPGVNTSLPFGLNPMLTSAYASMQTLGAGVSQALGLLPSLFGANNGSASTAAATTSAASKPGEPSPWTQGGPTGCGCGAKGCGGSKGSQSQGTQNQDATQRPQDSVSKQDSSGSGDLPPAPPPSVFNN